MKTSLVAVGAVQPLGQETVDSSNRGGQFARAVEPVYIRLFAKPDRLTPRIAPIFLSDEGSRGRLVANPVKMFERLTVDQTAEWPGALRNSQGEQAAYFVEQAARELIVHPFCHAIRDGRRRKPESNRNDLHPCDRRGGVDEVFGERPPRQPEHFQCAYDSLQISRLNACPR